MTDSWKNKSSIAAQLAALPNLPMHELWALWDQHVPRRPMRVVRHYLEGRLAYRLKNRRWADCRPTSKCTLPTAV